MGIGLKIKEWRTKAHLTQKELADELHVTYQAVSRWENDDAEPSFDTLKEICRILGCTTDDLFGIEHAENKETSSEETPVHSSEKPILAICSDCHGPIYDKEDRHEKEVSDGFLKRKKIVLCSLCLTEQEKQEKKDQEARDRAWRKKIKARRIHSFIWPTLLASIFVCVAISYFSESELAYGIIMLIAGLLAYLSLGTLILDNTFASDTWSETLHILGGSVFSLPLTFLLATLLLIPLSPVAYPIALVRSFTYSAKNPRAQ